MMRRLRSPTLLLALAVAAPATAQVTGPGGGPGWIGVSFQLLTTGGTDGTRTEATITEVRDGSPAQEAGLRPGDHLLSVNGVEAQLSLESFASTLHPGDPVRVVVERDGRRLDIRMRAVPRPRNLVLGPSTMTWTVGSDSVVDAMFQAMDSLRLRLARTSDGRVRIIGIPGSGDSIEAVIAGLDRNRISVTAWQGRDTARGAPVLRFIQPVPEGGADLFPEVHAPFDFYVVGGPEHDSLRLAMADVNRKLLDARAEEQARARMLAAAARAGDVIDAQDKEIVRLRHATSRLEARAEALRVSMRRAVGATAGAPAWGTNVADIEPEVVRFRPLTPYRLGQNWVAGAQMVDLKPELGAYFNVPNGVLVVEVPSGTPAALAGLRAGDVIVQVGSLAVHSIADLRTGLSAPGDTLRIQLVRKGKTVGALLGR